MHHHVKIHFCQKDLSLISHYKRFSPMWIWQCTVTWQSLQKILLQISHLGYSMVWSYDISVTAVYFKLHIYKFFNQCEYDDVPYDHAMWIAVATNFICESSSCSVDPFGMMVLLHERYATGVTFQRFILVWMERHSTRLLCVQPHKSHK